MLSNNQWGRRIVAGIGMVIDSVSLVLLPLILKDVFDLLSSGKDAASVVGQLNRSIGIAVVFAILRAVGIYVETYFQEGTGNYISHDIRQLLVRKLLRLPFSFFDRTKTGDLMSVLTRDVDAVRDGTGFVIMLVIVNFVTAVGIIVAMFRLNPLFAVIVLATFPFLFALTILYSKLVGPMYKDVQESSGKLHTVAQENVSGIRVVKAFVRHQEEEAKFQKQNLGLYAANLRIAFLNSIVHPSLDFLGGGAGLVALGVGGIFVIKGQMTLGTLVAFTNFADFLVWPIRMIGWLAEMFQRATAGARRIYQVLDEKDTLVQPDQHPITKPMEGRITFKDVSFTYPEGDEALRDFSMEVAPGQKVCILGTTGSGKTTVANLVPRFYDATSGTVSIDGIDVRQWDLETLRSQIGFVFQDNFLFSTTLKDNLTMGREIPQEQITSAVQVAQADEFIANLPKGYETVVGERGIGLSGGERQRVAIARALLREPRILIFDDSTSSLDVKTEAALKGALERLFAGRTVLIIAQRVSTAMSADHIIVLQDGRIVEQGTHRELLAKNGVYTYLYKVQSMQTLCENDRLEVTADG